MQSFKSKIILSPKYWIFFLSPMWVIFSSGCSSEDSDNPTIGSIAELEVEHFVVTSREHIIADIDYPTIPPVGGDHLSIWQNCGIYTVPVIDEAAVHSLEHGAIWVTYREDIGIDEIVVLSDFLAGLKKILMSPYPNQLSAVVLTAWGVRLELDKIDTQVINSFVQMYRDSETAPEPGVLCDQGIGDPPADPYAGLN